MHTVVQSQLASSCVPLVTTAMIGVPHIAGSDLGGWLPGSHPASLPVSDVACHPSGVGVRRCSWLHSRWCRVAHCMASWLHHMTCYGATLSPFLHRSAAASRSQCTLTFLTSSARSCLQEMAAGGTACPRGSTGCCEAAWSLHLCASRPPDSSNV